MGFAQALTDKGLRERVLLRVDGGMRSGRDVLVSAALGGDEYGFGTVAMIATGCIMARVCHTNNCPVGVASQREELRARFPGAPADLVRPGCGFANPATAFIPGYCSVSAARMLPRPPPRLPGAPWVGRIGAQCTAMVEAPVVHGGIEIAAMIGSLVSKLVAQQYRYVVGQHTHT